MFPMKGYVTPFVSNFLTLQYWVYLGGDLLRPNGTFVKSSW